MDQRDHEFAPRVLAVRAGQSVKFTNSDPANHNVRATASEPANQFNVFTGMDGSYTHRFIANSGSRPVRVGCDIHPWMRGWLYVFEHPWFAVTDEHGSFRIDSVPAGEYTLVLEQPDIRHRIEQSVTVSGDKTTEVEFEIREEDLPNENE